ncbi:MAG: hypothetical protein L3K15_00095 [Thermoplasmata archaeon]|nr:hypothetical protein [Thermoplasmata archaeon]
MKPGASGGTDVPLPPPLARLGFAATGGDGSALALRAVCIVAANGTVLGTYSGASGGWATQASATPPTCQGGSTLAGNLPPGSISLTVGSMVFYELPVGAGAGTTVWMSARPTPGGGWDGSISQTMA